MNAVVDAKCAVASGICESASVTDRYLIIVLAVNHKPTWKCVQAERMLIAELGWNSCAPVGVHAELMDEKLHLRASAFGVKGAEIACAESSGPADDVEKLAKSVAEDLIRAGGDRIIREARLKAY